MLKIIQEKVQFNLKVLQRSIRQEPADIPVHFPALSPEHHNNIQSPTNSLTMISLRCQALSAKTDRFCLLQFHGDTAQCFAALPMPLDKGFSNDCRTALCCLQAPAV